jgi:CheY-like chemotaxis protein
LYEVPAIAKDINKTFLSSGIKAAGRYVHRVCNSDQLESALRTDSPDAVVIATCPKSRDSASDKVIAILRCAVEQNPALLLVSIDKALNKFNSSGDVSVEQICRLPLFPTSNEIAEAFDTGHIKAGLRTLAERVNDVASSIRVNPLRVLVAEDVVINQKVMIKLLARLPCTVQIANNGLEAVELAGMHKYDLILMDCVMPVMDGLEATRLIRKTDMATHIVALTANATTDDRRNCLEAGCDDFMPKPVSLDLLCSIFAKISKSTEPKKGLQPDNSASIVHAALVRT